MRRLGTAPTKNQLDQHRTTDFLQTVEERFNVYTGTADPTVDQVPAGQWVLYKNTTTGQVRLWTNDSGTLRSVLLVSTDPPVFSAYLNGTQVIPTATLTKVTLNAEVYDSASSFDTTNYRFQPTVAGYYRINSSVYFTASVAGAQLRTYLAKNGVVYKAGLSVIAASAAQQGSNCSALIPLNGTTDYVELFVYQATGVNQTLNGSAFSTGTDVYMDGELVRYT
jgi:hypothetical protein